MIPSYKEEVKITVVDQKEDEDKNLLAQINELKDQVRQLSEMVNYMDRERSRIKSELENIKGVISRK